MIAYLILLTSIRNLFANKLRTSLTLLGIIIGVATVLMMISIGNSATVAVTSAIQGLGSNLIFVFNLQNAPETKLIDESDAEAISRLPHVRRVLPQVNLFASVAYISRTKNATLVGTLPHFEDMRNFHPVIGRFINHSDVISSEKVAVIGFSIYKDLFQDEFPVGKVIRINGVPFRVIGVTGKKGSQSIGYNPDEMIIVPITTLQQRFVGSKKIDVISVETDSENSISILTEEINELLKRRHGFKNDEEATFRIITQEEVATTVSQVTNILTILLAGIASISLLVGGIGIMNIMLVTVTERTREIGIRKAVGARQIDILLQFLFESTILCSLGGLIGVIAGYFGNLLVASFGNWTPVVYPSTVLLSFGFAVFVGLFFGLYPAYKAASLNPIDALRYE